MTKAERKERKQAKCKYCQEAKQTGKHPYSFQYTATFGRATGRRYTSCSHCEKVLRIEENV